MEKCSNPFNSQCENGDIALYIEAGQEIYSICKSCWLSIADDGVEWDEQGIRKASYQDGKGSAELRG